LPMSLRLEGFPDLLRRRKRRGGERERERERESEYMNEYECFYVGSIHYLIVAQIYTYFCERAEYVHLCVCVCVCVRKLVDLCGVNMYLHLGGGGCACMCGDCSVAQVHVWTVCSHLAFCSCLRRILSRRCGLGIKAMSPPSFTSLPIHQSLLYFWGWSGAGRGSKRN
jgi:hypothetical protein